MNRRAAADIDDKLARLAQMAREKGSALASPGRCGR